MAIGVPHWYCYGHWYSPLVLLWPLVFPIGVAMAIGIPQWCCYGHWYSPLVLLWPLVPTTDVDNYNGCRFSQNPRYQEWEVLIYIAEFLDVQAALRWSQTSILDEPIRGLLGFRRIEVERRVRVLPTIAKAA